MAGKTLKLALVGAGAIALTEHLPVWATRDDVEIVSIVDADAARAKAAAERFGASSWHTDYQQVIADSNVDAVDICSPPTVHTQMTIDFLDAGIHVLLEKPFVLNLDDAALVLDAEARSNAVLMIAENWPYASPVTRVVEAINEGLLGDLYMLRAHHENSIWDYDPELVPPTIRLDHAGGGLTMSAGIHAINLARYLLGDITELFAYSSPPGTSPKPWIDREVVLAARCGEERLVSMNFTGRAKLLDRRRLAFALFGTRGVAEFEMLTGEVTLTYDGTSRTYVDRNPSMGYVEEIDHFIECITSGTPVRTPASDQMTTIATVLAVYESMATGQIAKPAGLPAKSDPVSAAR